MVTSPFIKSDSMHKLVIANLNMYVVTKLTVEFLHGDKGVLRSVVLSPGW